jgi:hypothetical protein
MLEVEVIEDDNLDFVDLVTRIESISSSIVALVLGFSELACANDEENGEVKT